MIPGYKEHYFGAHDGLQLFFRYWFVPGNKGLVALVHGFAEHSGRYQTLARTLCNYGWSVATFDYRGHGLSEGKRAHIKSFNDYIEDVDQFLGEINSMGFSEKPILLGHSLGGLITTRYAQIYPKKISALALSSPFLGLAQKVPTLKAFSGKAISRIIPSLSLKTDLDPNHLTHDKEAVNKYVNDPLVTNIASARWFTEILAAQKLALSQARRLTMPMLVMQAGEDKIVSNTDTKRLFIKASTRDKLFHLYDDFYHEIFNEIEKKKPYRDLLNWLENFSKEIIPTDNFIKLPEEKAPRLDV